MNIGNTIKLNKSKGYNHILDVAGSHVWYSDKGPSRLLIREKTLIFVNTLTNFNTTIDNKNNLILNLNQTLILPTRTSINIRL